MNLEALDVNNDNYAMQVRRRRLSLYLLLRRTHRRRQRNIWVREIFSTSSRREDGAHNNLIDRLRLSDPEKHFNYLRMSPAQFDELLSLVDPLITKHHLKRESISASIRLALTLRYLASGDSMVSLSYAFRVGISTVSGIIAETCAALWEVLKDQILKQPEEEDWIKVANEFSLRWNFPNCIGAIDGKHVVMQAIPSSGSAFYNYKGSHSLVLMAISDANYCFTAVDIGAQGRQSDSGIFRLSNMGQQLETNTFNIPPMRKISSTRRPLPFVFVADEAFPLTSNIMRPYARGALTQRTRIFNYHLSRARRVIESAFGILVARWRIFRKPILANIETVQKIVQACVCLHNWLKMHDDALPAENRKYVSNVINSESAATREDGLVNVQCTGSNTYGREAAEIRNTYMLHFNDEGAVEWQWDKAANNEF